MKGHNLASSSNNHFLKFQLNFINNNVDPIDSLSTDFVVHEYTQIEQVDHNPLDEGSTNDATVVSDQQTMIPCNPSVSQRSTRQHKPPSFLKNYHYHTLTHGSPPIDTILYHRFNKSVVF